ncbi:MAG: TonB-dependent receptor family protein [Limisphaerales bacterium]
MLNCRILVALLMLFVSVARAETNLVQLAPTSVTARSSVSLVDWGERRLSEPNLTVDEALRRVPGVFVQNSFNFAQDQRISIRGFGTRAAFGVREIKLLVDGIPESSPDGQTQLDNLDLGSISRIEVLRRSVSSLYGNASGGAINVRTDWFEQGPFLQTRLSGGSFGYHRYQLNTGGRLGEIDYLVNGSWSSIDGYRQHSGSENQFVGGKLRHSFDQTSELTAVFNYAHTPWSRDSGGLTRAEVDADRKQARARNVALDAGEEVRQRRLGFIYRHWLGEGQLTLTQHSLFRDFNNKLPILPIAGDGIVEFDRLGVGGGARYDWETARNEFNVGLDAELQQDDRQRYANITGTRGALGLDQVESVRSVGTYVRNVHAITEDHRLIAGLRYDNVRFEADDRFLVDGDDSGSRALDQFSWSVGLEYDLHPEYQLFADVSTAFQTPTTTEFANPTGGGGFNTALEPQTALTYEIGAKSRLSARTELELSLFLLQIDDELIPFTSPSGRDFFRNAGRSERKGIELGLEHELTRDLTWRTSYSVMDARYRDYVTAGGAFSGNREPGIPAHQIFSELHWSRPRGFFGSIDLQYVDQFELNDANTVQNDSYTLVNARIGYIKEFERSTLTPFVALNNLLNLRYNGQTRLNAFGGRFFEPAPRFAAFGGLTWRMEF